MDAYDIPGVADAFHPPVPNNFVHLLIPRAYDPIATTRAIAVATSPLNRADEALLEACAVLLAERGDPLGERALEGWRECIRRRVNLQGITWATEVAARLEATREGAPALSERLRRDHPQVLALFRAVPRSQLERVRINGYLRPEQIGPVLAALTADVRDAVVGPVIDRVEVARLAQRDDRRPIDFPTLIVYLRADISTDDTLASAIARVARRLAAAGLPVPPRTEYAWLLAPNATLTQGYFLFKRYLALVGLLDELYDRAFDHALARPTLGGIERIVRGSRRPGRPPADQSFV